MAAFFISLLFGAAEVILLKFTLNNFTAGKNKTAVLFLGLKLLLYAAAFALLFLVFPSSIKMSAVGFAVGMPLFAIILFAFTAFKKDR